MSIPTEYESILKHLESATKSGGIEWESADYSGFVVKIDDNRLRIWVGTDDESGVDFVAFALQDTRGKSLDSWSVDRGEAGYTRMWELFSEARRRATGVHEKLKSIESLLKDRVGPSR